MVHYGILHGIAYFSAGHRSSLNKVVSPWCQLFLIYLCSVFITLVS